MARLANSRRRRTCGNGFEIVPSGAGHRAGWQLRDVGRDLAGLSEPDLVAMTQNMLHGAPELPQTEWLAQDEGVQHERADQGLALARLVEHLIELVDPGRR